MNDSSSGSRATVLVTGGCGYLGSLLIRDLAGDDRLGRPVVRILDNFQRGRHQALLDLPGDGEVELVEGDVLDPSSLRRALSGVEWVIHLAAVVRTPFSFENPVWLEQVNHWGTRQLVEACLEVGVERVLLASTCAVYGPGGPFDEADPCRPMGPYAVSKRRSEETVLTATGRGLRPVIARLATLYGSAPVMDFQAVANRFCYLAGVGRSLTVYGTGEQRRPVVHVQDASDGIRWLVANAGGLDSTTYNVVTESPTILELAEAVRAQRPETTIRFTDQDIRTHLSLAAENDRLRGLGWRPTIGLGTGLGELLGRLHGLKAAYPAVDDLE